MCDLRLVFVEGKQYPYQIKDTDTGRTICCAGSEIEAWECAAVTLYNEAFSVRNALRRILNNDVQGL